MQSFDEITEKQINLVNEALTVGFKSGAQSRQQEVDILHTEIDDLKNKVFGLQKQVNKEREEATEFFTDAEYAFSKNRELQKRIDKCIFILSSLDNGEDAYKSIDLLMKELKGENK